MCNNFTRTHTVLADYAIDNCIVTSLTVATPEPTAEPGRGGLAGGAVAAIVIVIIILVAGINVVVTVIVLIFVQKRKCLFLASIVHPALDILT